MSEPHLPLQPALPIAELDFDFHRCGQEIMRSLTALSKNWILAPFSPVVRGEGLGMRGWECLKRNYILGIGHLSPLTPRPPLPETGRGGERFLVSHPNLDFHHFNQAMVWVRGLIANHRSKVRK